MKFLRLCAIGLHKWGDVLYDARFVIPSEEDLWKTLFDGTVPMYPYRECAMCKACRYLPKIYIKAKRP